MNENKHIDLVLCNCAGHPHLFNAPAWSGLEEGDTVIIESYDSHSTTHGDNKATVIDVFTTVPDREEYKFIVTMAAAAGMLPIRRIKSRVTYDQMDYSDYDDDCGVNGAEVSE